MSRPCTGVVLAGGLATRYGGKPKGLEQIGGERIVDRVARALRHCCDRLLLVANDPDAGGWLPGVPCFSDIHPGAGGLGGIHSGLHHSGSDIIVLAWDMPFAEPALLAQLKSAALREQADAVLPASGSRRGVEPLCAFYSARCLGPVEQCLSAGDNRVIAFHSLVRTFVLPEEEVSRHGDPARLFMNVNSPADLAVAEEYAAATNGDRGWAKEQR